MEIALTVLLNRIFLEVNSHTNCVLTNNISIMNDFPNVRSDCRNSSEFDKRIVWGVNHGCALFVTSEECVELFFERFLTIHDGSKPKFEKKVLIIVDFDGKLENNYISRILKSEMVTRWLPLTLLLQNNRTGQWINVFSTTKPSINRFFTNNLTLEHETFLISDLLDLEGKEIVTALFEYPPFVSIKKVPPGEGNANQFGSNKSLSLVIQGIEGSLMVEFCRKFNCVISARLEYEEDLWGWGFPNHTGTGILGAILKYDADLTGDGCYLMGDRYNIIQYTRAIQRSSVIHVLPKPKPLPYWNIPILPFSSVIWKYVILILLSAAILIYFLNRVQLKILPELKEKIPSDLGLIVLKMSLFQNAHINYSTMTNTVIYGIFLIYSLIIGNFYLGGLSSVMTVTPYEPPVDTMQKLVNTKYLWGGVSITWIYAIKESEDPIHKIYVSKFVEKSLEDLHKLLETEKLAVIVDKTQGGTVSLQNLVDREDSTYLMTMTEPLYTQYTTLITTKTWPYMAQLNKIVFWQQESGIRTYWEYKTVVETMDYVVQKNLRDNMRPAGNSSPVKLSIPHILGAGFILLFGFSFAGIALIVEISYEKYLTKTTFEK